MALQSEAIESRLEGLKLDDRRKMFDSKLRAFRKDEEGPDPAENRASRPAKKLEPDHPHDRVIALLEELSRRIDGLEKKDRALADEIRRRARRDQRRRVIYYACGLTASGLLILGRFLRWH